MRTIPLRQGLAALVDDEDYDRVRTLGWTWSKVRYNIYVYHRVRRRKAGVVLEHRNIYLHRFVMDAPPGMVVDHINGNPLDNRKRNLRITTYGDNNKRKFHFRGKTYQMSLWDTSPSRTAVPRIRAAAPAPVR